MAEDQGDHLDADDRLGRLDNIDVRRNDGDNENRPASKGWPVIVEGVANRARTGDLQNHNLAL